MDKTTRIALITIITFAVYFIVDDLYFRPVRQWLYEIIDQSGVSHIIAYIIFGIPIFAATKLMNNGKGCTDSLGLNRSIGQGILIALICTLPMFIGFAVVFKLNTEITLDDILIGIVAAAFFEELFFRGFLFGQLYRYTRLGFIPSVLLGSLVFAVIHLYQSQDFMTLVGIFAITFLGSILFAWIFVEWNYNIWVPVFMHFFMNAAWAVFSVSDNAFGGMYGNIFRILTLILVISITIIYKKKKGLKFEINKRTIWMKPVDYTPNLKPETN